MNRSNRTRLQRLEAKARPAEALQIIVINAPGSNPGCAMLPATGGHVEAREGETEAELMKRVRKDHLGSAKPVAILSPEDFML